MIRRHPMPHFRLAQRCRVSRAPGVVAKADFCRNSQLPYLGDRPKVGELKEGILVQQGTDPAPTESAAAGSAAVK